VSFHSSRNDERRVSEVVSSALKITVPLSLIFMLIVFSLSERIASLFHEPALTIVLRVLSVVIPLQVMVSLLEAINKAYKRVEYVIFIRRLFFNISRLVFLLAFMYLGLLLMGVLAAFVLSFLISLILLARYTRRFFSFKLTPGLDRELLSYSWPLLFTSLLANILLAGRVDTIMIAYFSKTVDVALYNTAYPTAALLLLAPTAILSIFLPVITEKFAKNRSIESDYKTVTRWILLINMPFAVLLVLFSKDLLTLLFGGKYSPASSSLVVLSIFYLLYSLACSSENVLRMFKKTRFLLDVMLIQVIVNIVLDYLLIPAYGIAGAAISSGIASLFTSVAYFTAAYRLTGIPLFDRTCLKPIFSVILSAIVVYSIKSIIPQTTAKMLYLPVLTITFIAVYLVTLVATNTITREDKSVLEFLRRGISPRRNLASLRGFFAH
jgi:O-antigen/teichoic acid export membrane protein